MAYVSRDKIALSSVGLVSEEVPQLIYDITNPAAPVLSADPAPIESASGVVPGKYLYVRVFAAGVPIQVAAEATLNDGIYVKTQSITVLLSRSAASGFAGVGVLDTTWTAVKTKVVADLTTAKHLTTTAAVVSKFPAGYLLT